MTHLMFCDQIAQRLGILLDSFAGEEEGASGTECPENTSYGTVKRKGREQ